MALGSNLGDRRYNVLRAMHELRALMHVVRVSSIIETAAVDAPAGSPPFLNAVIVGYTSLAPLGLLDALLAIEKRLGRVRRGVRNEPRVIDLDLIVYGAVRMRSERLTLPHPRAHEREFVMGPLRSVRADYLVPMPEPDSTFTRARFTTAAFVRIG
ncbi:MAG TPA: 2-amino-4-hydroxy-6-hydroxymethyldihydropteridine diphosphokinase [Thermoanaerobaculia bacterium]